MPPSALAGLRKARNGSETATVKAILSYLHLRGYLAWRCNTGAFKAEHAGKTRFHRFGVKGMSDIIGCVPTKVFKSTGPNSFAMFPESMGRMLAIEVKSTEGKPTPEQTAFLAAVVRAGGIAFLARSVQDVQEHGL